MDYSDWDAYDLTEALELSGEVPPPELLETILDRGDKVVPGLLEMLEAGVDETWVETDPRWFRDIHAALLLTEMAEPQALPVLERLYRSPDRQGDISFWVNPRLPRYGAEAFAMLERLLTEPDASHVQRVAAIIGLSHLASVPDLRERVVPLLRDVLPPLQEDGTPALPEDEDIGYDQVEPWTWAVDGLMNARDQESRQRILDLYDLEVIDDWVVDPDEFEAAMDQPPSDTAPELPSLPDYYQQKYEEEEVILDTVSDLQENLELLALMEQIQEATGLGDDEMAELLGRMEELADEEGGEIDEARVQQELMQMLAQREGGLDNLANLPPIATHDPFERGHEKIGRNDRVTIQDPDTGATETMKYKHAQRKLAQGWQLLDRA